ncbi:hypothetical protein KRX56_01625 [Dermabacteraceae bacterium TAE3-ERU27]|nr:hypothetical protein [Dermabacteraceae bacterium TAE3-ERU27]
MFHIWLPSEVKNPLDGISPNIGVFGKGFSGLANTLLSGVWGIALAVAACYIILNGLKWATARKQARTDDLTEAAGSLKISLAAFAVIVAAPIIVRAIIAVVEASQ